MDRKRVVVTGMGMISPIGNDVQESWNASLSGESGVKLNEAFETLSVCVAQTHPLYEAHSLCV